METPVHLMETVVDILSPPVPHRETATSAEPHAANCLLAFPARPRASAPREQRATLPDERRALVPSDHTRVPVSSLSCRMVSHEREAQ